MTVSDRDLFLAILAMDSYNRGYGAGLIDESLDESGQIGNAQVLSRQALGITDAEYAAWQAAGFYAVAYQTQYGTVISYRGTDNLAVFGSTAAASDICNAWTGGAGQPGDEVVRVGR